MRTLHLCIIWMVYLPIVLGTYCVVWLDRKFQFKLSFPRDVSALTQNPFWLFKQLQKANKIVSSATYISSEVIPLKSEMIFRSEACVVNVSYTLSGTHITERYFVKFAPTKGTVWNRTVFNLQLNHIKETDFNGLFIQKDTSIPAPLVFLTLNSPLTGNLCLVTEYMQHNIEFQDSIYSGFERGHLDIALDGLAALHAKFWRQQSTDLKNVMPIEPSTVLLFDNILWWAGISKNTRKVVEHSWLLMNETETVLHGDARIGNMMFPKSENEGRFVLFDWQAVRQGKAAYDLAYFLVLSLETAYRKNVEEEAKLHYYNSLLQKGVSEYSLQQFSNDYNHACLCVLSLLSLPFLSGEASAEGEGAKIFAWGMNVWKERLVLKFSDFDYNWMSNAYQLSEVDCRQSVSELIAQIETRLSKITTHT